MNNIVRTQLYRKIITNVQLVTIYNYLQLFRTAGFEPATARYLFLTTTVRCSTPELSSVGNHSLWLHRVYTHTFFNMFTNKKYMYVFFILIKC